MAGRSENVRSAEGTVSTYLISLSVSIFFFLQGLWKNVGKGQRCLIVQVTDKH